MSEISFTKSQRAAIDVKAPKILVSAAAGSGKSTVLTERIISSVTSEENPFDISKILAVTFTKASAEDLKAKISRAVRNAVSLDPQNTRLKNQLIKLSSAKISTIHGLCFNLIKTHFQMLGLSAAMRVADETESSAIASEVLGSLLESAYAGYFEPIPDFSYFAENFIAERDDALNGILTDVYRKIKNIPDGFSEWERKIAALRYVGDFGKSDFGQLIIFQLRLFADYAVSLCQSTVKRLSDDRNYREKYVPSFEYDISFLLRLKKAAERGSFDEISALLSEYSPLKLGNVSAALKTDAGEYARTVVKPYIKDKIKEFGKNFFSVSEREIKESGEATAEISGQLVLLLKEFDKRFSAEKLRRSVLDFNDLEHYTLKLLYNDDGSVSDCAKRISESLDEIYVDEYQDVNPLQSKIFEALSVSCPIFTVGDIKQSIYSFRGARPSIFADCRRSFSEYLPEKNRYERDVTVFLSDNFRSSFGVTEFVNAVSEQLFYTPSTDPLYSYRIPYSKDDRLVCNIKDGAPPVSILIAESSKVSDSDDGDGAAETAPSAVSACSLEAEAVANKISELILSGVNPDGIAILLRSTKTDAAVFEAALKKRNIPTVTDNGSSLFDTPEVQLSLCLLNCIDNPYRDIFLAGALRSPIFGFTLNDLILIRRSSREDSSLFDALREYTALHSFRKGEYFLKFLSSMRAFAAQSTVDRTLWQIYTETAFFSLIYDGGEARGTVPDARRANLLKLHLAAKAFSASGKCDLYSFIEHLRTMMTDEKPPSAASIQSEGVKIMSIHRSKGLEFSHCFLSRTSRRFSTESHKSAVTVDSDYGMAMRIKDSLRLTSSDTIYRRTLIMQSDITRTEEEMRLLYVALSRAQTALYITGETKSFSTLERRCLYSADTPHPMLFASQSSYLEWILTALKCKTDLSPRYTLTVKPAEEILKEASGSVLNTRVAKSKPSPTEYTEDAYSTLKERFDFVYPHENAAKIPSKLSVSRLTPKILDEDAAEDIFFGDDGEFLSPTLDLFISSGEPPLDGEDFIRDQKDAPADREASDALTDISNNSAKLKVPSFMLDTHTASASEKGTATHVFMQFCDFKNVEKHGVEAEISRLTEKRFILPSHAEMIDRDAVRGFFRSELYTKIGSSAFLQREYRFNIKLPASDFTENSDLKRLVADDFIFVQGVIDCYFRDECGRLYLIDYKTDRVPSSIKGDPEKERRFFTEKHSSQLGYYKKALEKLTGEKVFRTLIYSFALGKTVELD